MLHPEVISKLVTITCISASTLSSNKGRTVKFSHPTANHILPSSWVRTLLYRTPLRNWSSSTPRLYLVFRCHSHTFLATVQYTKHTRSLALIHWKIKNQTSASIDKHKYLMYTHTVTHLGLHEIKFHKQTQILYTILSLTQPNS
jgi:hypothetical protein